MDKNAAAINVFNKRAQQYQEKYMDVSMYAAALDAFFERMPEKASVLELACGPGYITKYLLAKRPDLRILATLRPICRSFSRKQPLVDDSVQHLVFIGSRYRYGVFAYNYLIA
ncbi:MAG: putative Methylase involved in ubiquinone/menaquinone biosynthesis [Flavipsychrobacter sp.]|jgi:hypothetical protein|nr:putative Methylase involved in ubiquinone/menaquinone biosynthesis [Flavipsychrobacter sp.]